MKKTFAAIAISGALLAGCAAPAPAPAPATSPAALPECVTEDYSGPDACYWDASKRSNGKGKSFTWDGSKVIYTSK